MMRGIRVQGSGFSNVDRTLRVRRRHTECAYYTARTGISLLEVLISIFILAVGILSIATLLPVGSYQVQKAVIEDRKSTIGQNAFHEFRTRGMANSGWWKHYLSGPAGKDIFASGPVDTNLSKYFPLSVAIDPLCLMNTNTGFDKSKLFPRLPAGVANDDGLPRMPRVNLSFITSREIAEQIFVSHDDAVFEKSASPDSPPISKWELDNNARPMRRQFEGNFSWLVTLTPTLTQAQFLAQQLPTATTQYNVSIAIFFRRNLNARFNDQGVELERMVGVSQRPNDLVGFGLGGGELALAGDSNATPQVNQANTAVKPGQWVIVAGRYANQPNGGAVFRWYRVSTVGAYDTNTNNRPVTLAGPDWGYDASRCSPTHAAIFEGCVGVFEKTVHLEGPSVWGN